MTTTLLEDLLENNLSFKTKENEQKVTVENMCSLLLDFSNEEDTRFSALLLFYKSKGYEVVEILKKLVSIFCMGQTKLLERFLCRVCRSTELPYSLRFETCKDVCLIKDDSDEIFSLLHDLLTNVDSSDTEITFVKRLEAITTMMRNNKFFEYSKAHMLSFLSNKIMSSEYRYKSILSLKTQFDLRKRWMTEGERKDLDNILFLYQKDCLSHFAHDNQNEPYFRILASQLYLVQFVNQDETVCDILLSIGLDDTQNYNTRADAIDVVLRYGSENAKEKAKELILYLGCIGQENDSILYNNAQNAHNFCIEQSAVETLNRLASIPLIKKGDGKAIDFEYVSSVLSDSLNDNGKIALNRIKLDNALYGNLDLSLKSALVLIYSFIQTHEYKDLLLSRLCEELSESSGICSTGIMERMTNTFTGIVENFGIRISFEDQILCSISGRLNNKILSLMNEPCLHLENIKYCTCMKKLCAKGRVTISGNVSADECLSNLEECGICSFCKQKDSLLDILKTRFLKREDFKCVHICDKEENCNQTVMDKILEEMTIPVRYFDKRQTFLLFFRKNFPFIYDDLYKEYQEHIDYTTFDLYMRKAVIHYVGEE